VQRSEARALALGVVPGGEHSPCDVPQPEPRRWRARAGASKPCPRRTCWLAPLHRPGLPWRRAPQCSCWSHRACTLRSASAKGQRQANLPTGSLLGIVW